MHKLAKYALCAALLLSVAPAFAADAIVSWTNPTTYIDGRPLPAADLKEIVVKWGRTATGPYDVGTATVAAPATSVTVPNLVCGNYHFVAYAVVKTLEQSGPSNVALKATGVSCNIPNPPSAVAAQ